MRDQEPDNSEWPITSGRQMAQGPGPHLPLHEAPCPAETWGRRPDQPTRLLRRIRSSAGWDSLCTPGPAAYLSYMRLRTSGGGLRTPHSGLQGSGRAWPGTQWTGGQGLECGGAGGWCKHGKCILIKISICYSVAKSCPAVCDPMETVCFPVLHYLPKLAQAHVC